jgi:hypothetical protein
MAEPRDAERFATVKVVVPLSPGLAGNASWNESCALQLALEVAVMVAAPTVAPPVSLPVTVGVPAHAADLLRLDDVWQIGVTAVPLEDKLKVMKSPETQLPLVKATVTLGSA